MDALWYLAVIVCSGSVIYSSTCSQQDITIDFNPLTADAVRLTGTDNLKATTFTGTIEKEYLSTSMLTDGSVEPVVLHIAYHLWDSDKAYDSLQGRWRLSR